MAEGGETPLALASYLLASHVDYHLRYRPPSELQKKLKETNITIQKDAIDDVRDKHLAAVHMIAADDAAEVMWFHGALDGASCTPPPETYSHSIKALCPTAELMTSRSRTFTILRSSRLTA